MAVFIITATNRENRAEVIQFVVNADGAKDAWGHGRAIARDGGTVELLDGSGTRDLGAREYTVVHARKRDKPSKRKEPTALELIAECERSKVTVPNKVREMLDAMRQDRGLIDNGDDGGEGEAEAA